MGREQFGSRLGFILISAGCAIGLGNVWRFPYITGEYGGAAFVIIYLIFLVIFGLPIMAMEFATGRASQKGIARSFNTLEKPGQKWHIFKWVALAGNLLLMMFYTVVAGWMLSYVFKTATGTFDGATPEAISDTFSALLASPGELIFWLAIIVVACGLICSLGIQKGVERITKVMMIGLFALIIVLVIRAVTLDGASEGLAFYLKPDFSKLFAGGISGFGTAVYAAMGQSFFTLSIGIGSMAIFGSYINKKKSLAGEAAIIGVLDTFIAVMAGLIIFPACFSFGVEPGSGPSLIFISLPNVFNQMFLGRLWGSLFFLFMTFAAVSTVIAVFENIISFGMDQWGWSRKKSSFITIVAIFVLSLPCALGFNVWSDVLIPGVDGGEAGNIQALEDFIVSNNLLPIGSLVFVLFCTSKRGWGWKNFLEEVNAGEGLKYPKWLYGWMHYGVPVLVVIILIMGWIPALT